MENFLWGYLMRLITNLEYFNARCQIYFVNKNKIWIFALEEKPEDMDDKEWAGSIVRLLDLIADSRAKKRDLHTCSNFLYDKG